VAWDIANPEVQAFISDYSFKFANGLGATTKESLRGLTASAQAEGWSINKLRDELTGIYGGWDKTRAQMIAQTETIRSSNAGAVASYAKAGIEYKQWFTAEDGKVCGYCQEMHGKIVGVSETYWAMGDEMTINVEDQKPTTMTFTYEDVGAPPLHPNCRCTILPVVEEV
jgi:SPP1 gp7 family putative phage head morphogenesis protein